MLATPIWRVAILAIFDVFPTCLSAPLIVKIEATQFGKHAYTINGAAHVLQSAMMLCGVLIFGRLCEPWKWGRRLALFVLALGSSAPIAVAALRPDAYAIRFSRVLFAVVGGSGLPLPAINVLHVWITDWCAPEDRAGLFGVLIGVMFGVESVAPQISRMLRDAGWTRSALLWLSLLIKACHPGLVLLLLRGATRRPSQPWDLRACDATPPSGTGGLPRRRWSGLGELTEALRLLVGPELRWATVVLLLTTFADSSMENPALLFLVKVRGFTGDMVAAYISVVGAAGLLAQLVLVRPLVACVGEPGLLLLGALATLAHGLGTGLVRGKVQLLLAAAVGTLAHFAPVACNALASRAAECAGQSQGLALGLQAALKAVAGSLGPLVGAVLLSGYQRLPAPLAFPGAGFLLLALLVLPALPAAALQRRSAKCRVERPLLAAAAAPSACSERGNQWS